MNEESKIDSAIHKREDEKMELVNPNNLIDLKQQFKENSPQRKNQDQKKELKKSTVAKLALLGSISDIGKDFYWKGASTTVPSMYMKFQNPMNEEVNEFRDAPDYDKNEDDGEDEDHECPTFQYGKQLNLLWENLQNKLVEKISDSRQLMSDELRQLHGRHRQFYKIQLDKKQLDKFEPDAKTVKGNWLQQFQMTALLYEDK